jgi:hypothetical protein
MNRTDSKKGKRVSRRVDRAARCRTAMGIALATACLCCTGRLVADPPDGPQASANGSAGQAERSLDDQLRESLGPGLFDDLDSLPGGDATTPDDGGTDSALDAELADQLLDGDDLGADGEGDPLTRIGLRMQVAQRRIETRKTAAVTQRLQQQAIDELAEIIEQLRKSKCSGGECQSSGNPGNADKTGKPSSSKGEGRTPAKSAGPVRSTQRVDASESVEARLERRRALVKQVWGHLPERIRAKIPNTSDEEFLPKYAEIIEEYFERLAEEGPANP